MPQWPMAPGASMAHGSRGLNGLWLQGPQWPMAPGASMAHGSRGLNGPWLRGPQWPMAPGASMAHGSRGLNGLGLCQTPFATLFSSLFLGRPPSLPHSPPLPSPAYLPLPPPCPPPAPCLPPGCSSRSSSLASRWRPTQTWPSGACRACLCGSWMGWWTATMHDTRSSRRLGGRREGKGRWAICAARTYSSSTVMGRSAVGGEGRGVLLGWGPGGWPGGGQACKGLPDMII